MLQGGLFTRDWLTEGILETKQWRDNTPFLPCIADCDPEAIVAVTTAIPDKPLSGRPAAKMGYAIPLASLIDLAITKAKSTSQHFENIGQTLEQVIDPNC